MLVSRRAPRRRQAPRVWLVRNGTYGGAPRRLRCLFWWLHGVSRWRPLCRFVFYAFCTARSLGRLRFRFFWCFQTTSKVLLEILIALFHPDTIAQLHEVRVTAARDAVTKTRRRIPTMTCRGCGAPECAPRLPPRNHMCDLFAVGEFVWV